ncbi:MAG: FecR domain-containing protein [Betaproteobacteria bacterium]|nr:MAG: FecR domain-containing protein [Betaproteobacteria bacterium]
MKLAGLWYGCCCLVASTLCLGADVGTATIVDGKAKLLRGTAWYKLVEGTVVRDSDVLDAPEGAEVQIELVDGGVVSITGPGALYAAAVTPRDARQAAAAELFIPRGWAKFATKANESRLRIRTPLGSVSTANAVAVAHVAPEGIEVFVENGSVKCLDPGKAEAGASDTKAGEFCGRASGKSFAIIGRAPSPFLSALPRQFMDPLPTRAAKFKNATVEPAMDREATLPEVQAWLNSPYRAAFLKRFEPRLSDPSFQAAVSGNAKAYPEWNNAAQPAPPVKIEQPMETPKQPPEPERKWRWPWEKSGK